LIFALYEYPEGVTTEPGNHVIYEVGRNTASFGATRVDEPALVWKLARGEDHLVTTCHKEGVALATEVQLDPGTEWLVRCDRVDFPQGGVAYRHVHPGPGIRRLLFGELTIESDDGTRTYGSGEAWFEGADYPVLATASPTGATAFVRVLLLPAEWAGKRTIRYLDPADEDKPKLQRAQILLEEPLRP
jgi:quercetin dioxygenase-like cupin family protein